MLQVHYRGKNHDYDYRIAEIEFTEDEKKLVNNIADLMNIRHRAYKDLNPYTIDVVTDGYALSRVDDIEDYKDFMKTWKQVKKEIKCWMKYGY